MKLLRFLPLVCTLTFVSCEKPTVQQAAPDDREVERRVQERVAEERRVDAEKQAREREQQLADRESKLTARERELQEQARAAQAQPAPREVQVVAAAPERTDADSYQIFYDALAPHGAWIELDNYGYVWQPRVALQNPRWRPYTVGHWAYTDYGWTWLSDEPWGWATYHYGRWTRLRRLGWVWVPGDDWAPAWVAWRNSDRFVGWAPLPPDARFDRGSGIRERDVDRFDIARDDYVFVPVDGVGEAEIATVVVPPEQNVTIFSTTVNVTNIVQNNTIIFNKGPDIAVVNSRSRKQIPQLKVEREQSTSRANKAEVSGQTVRFAAPQIKKAKSDAKPAQVSARTSDTKMNEAAAAPPEPAASAPPRRREAQRSAVPDATPQPLPQITPQTPPPAKRKATPRATPVATPQPSPETTPASTPEAVPESAPQNQPPPAATNAAEQRRAAIEAQRAARRQQAEAQRKAQPGAVQNEAEPKPLVPAAQQRLQRRAAAGQVTPPPSPAP
ncbi:MAG: hypothetical protein QOD99_1042 [Chthoniobacter sp.]|jgi:hypothetical protein|nr:hypothetical protein [Chthoniobacter sp.]